TGNTAIDPYQTEGALSRTIYSFGDQPAVGYRPGNLPNPDLTWERTGQADVGLEFGLLSGRVSGSVDVYRSSTNHLLMSRQLAGANGYSSIVQNVGATLNTGAEVALQTDLLRDWHGLAWTTQLTWARNRNRIVSLYGGQKDDVGNRWFIGYPISVYYDNKFVGIWQLPDSLAAKQYKETPGQIHVADVNGDGKIDASDRVILGTPFPRWTGSATSRFDWRGFDLSVMAVARWGFMVNDQFVKDNNVLAGRYNNLAVDYWTPTNPSNTNPRPNVDQEFPLYNSALGFEDGSFVRVRSVTLGYTVPGARVGPFRGRSLRVYVTALDPLLFTDFQGLDPESRTSAGTPGYWTVLTGLTVGLYRRRNRENANWFDDRHGAAGGPRRLHGPERRRHFRLDPGGLRHAGGVPGAGQRLVRAAAQLLGAGTGLHADRVRHGHLHQGRGRELQVHQRLYAAAEPHGGLLQRHVERLLSGDQHRQRGDRPGGDRADGLEPQSPAAGRSAFPARTLLLLPGPDVRAAAAAADRDHDALHRVHACPGRYGP